MIRGRLLPGESWECLKALYQSTGFHGCMVALVYSFLQAIADRDFASRICAPCCLGVDFQPIASSMNLVNSMPSRAEAFCLTVDLVEQDRGLRSNLLAAGLSRSEGSPCGALG